LEKPHLEAPRHVHQESEQIIILVIVLLIFGPKRLPGLGRQLGHGMREFKDSITGDSKDDEPVSRPELTSASASTPAPASAHRESATQRSA
jgi:sec-independent protein translocase protein TatA